MELKIDLTKTTKSKFRVVIGILSIVTSVASFYLTVYKKNELDFIQILFPIVLLFGGVVHLLEGLGYSIDRLLGQTAYIFIDTNKISLKTKSKIFNVLWTDILSITHKTNFFQVIKKDGSSTNIDMKKFGYSDRQKIKQIINSIADEFKIANS